MNRIRKSITVRFFSIEASESFFDDFIINFLANRDNSNSSRIFNLKTKNNLIKLGEEHILKENKAYSVSVVRERNTWQTKATSDGQITGISLNQGIIGDPYYFFVVPDKENTFSSYIWSHPNFKKLLESLCWSNYRVVDQKRSG